MKGCSVKRKSTIYGIPSSLGYDEDKDARTVFKEHAGDG